MSFIDTKGIDVVILCGGRGKRLRSAVKDRPKPMAEVGGVPFLDIIINFLAAQGFKRFILCIGYRGEYIQRYYRARKTNLEFIFSKELYPLGTGGAIKNALNLIKNDVFLVLNGDSYCDLNYCELINFHLEKKCLITMVAFEVAESKDYGTVTIDDDNRIVSFHEKIANRDKAYVNAGIYCMNKEVFLVMPDRKKFSLEYDFLPTIVNNQCLAYVTKHPFFDIGTPERYNTIKKRKD